jgi:hypothetical protein
VAPAVGVLAARRDQKLARRGTGGSGAPRDAHLHHRFAASRVGRCWPRWRSSVASAP